jgi:hypothetical protein
MYRGYKNSPRAVMVNVANILDDSVEGSHKFLPRISMIEPSCNQMCNHEVSIINLPSKRGITTEHTGPYDSAVMSPPLRLLPAIGL